jgi:hypothetical protein
MIRRLVHIVLLMAGLALAAPLQAAPAVKVRVGEHADYVRVVFDWPGKPAFTIERQDKNVFVRFQTPFTADLRVIGRELDPHVTSAYLSSDQKTVVLNLRQAYEVKSFSLDNSAVIDITLPKAAAAAPKPLQPAAAAKPPTPARPDVVGPAPQPAPAKPEGETGTPAPSATPPAPPPPTPAKPKNGFIAGPAVPFYIQAKTNQISLRFAWPMEVGAAVFRRGRYIWAVFSEPGRLLTNASTYPSSELMGAVEQVELENGTAVRFRVPDGINAVVSRDGLSWILDLRAQDNSPATKILVEVEPRAATGPRVFLKQGRIAGVYPIHDPEVGDILFAAPVNDAGHGVAQPEELVQFRILETAQGAAVEVMADGIKLTRSAGGLDITADTLLYTDPWLRSQESTTDNRKRLFDFAAMKTEFDGDFSEVKHKLEMEAATEEGLGIGARRLKLARFYFYRNFREEALGWLHYLKQEDPGLANDPEILGLEGAVQALQGRGEEAWTALRQSSLDNYADITLWRAAASALRADWDLAATQFQEASRIPADYPDFVRLNLQTLAARTAMANEDYEGAKRFLTDLIALQTTEPVHQLYPLLGEAESALGNKEAALAAYKKATESRHLGTYARGKMGLVRLQMQAKQIEPAAAIKELDSLRYLWGGDGFQFDLLRTLGQLAMDAGEYREGLKALRGAVSAFPGHPDAPRVTALMATTFADLYLRGKADALPPLKALALFDEFQELMPAEAAGDEMIAKLADRLVTMDLLGRAANLLEHQVQSRLQGVEKARVGTRLALIYLLDKDAAAAVKTLDATTMAGLPAPLQAERNRLAARAASDLGDPTQGLELLLNDMSLEAENLRADLFWQMQDWPNVLRSLLRLVGAPQLSSNRPGEKLDDRTAQYILNAAVAAALAGDNAALADLKQRYGQSMQETPFNQAFQIVSKDILPGQTLTDLATQLQEIQTFESFLQSYRDKIRDKGLSGVN